MSSALADTGTNFGLVAAMPRDIAMLKMENESFHAMAVARPRDFASIAAEMKKQFELFPSFAKAAIYSKPVGKDAEGKERTARNLSVRAAEAIAEAYGYCRVRTNVELIDGQPDVVRVEAYFTDYQKGKVWEDAAIVSKWYKDRSNKMVKIADDRFFSVTVRAAQSKLVREVILRSVAPGLRLELFDMAEKQLAKLLDDKEVDKIVSAFANHKVTQEMIESFLGRARAVGWTEEDRLNLLGVYNAIKDGEMTVDAAFAPDVVDADSKPSSQSAPSAVNEFVSGKKDSAKPKVASDMAAQKPKSDPKPQQSEPIKPKTEAITDPNPTMTEQKPFAAFRAQIVEADSQSRLIDIGKVVQSHAGLSAGEKTSLSRFAQKRMAEVIAAGTASPSNELSDAVKGYLSQIEKVDDPDAAQSVSIDILSDDSLSDSDRELLFAELRKKTD